MDKSVYLDFIAKQTQPIVIYVGIGCAAHRIEPVNNTWVLPPKANQEYPLFLQNLKKQYSDVFLHMFMIDPDLEKVPFVLTIGDKKTLMKDWVQVNEDQFYNQNENTTVYAIKEWVYHSNEYTPTPDQIVLNSTFFDKLNNYAKQYMWTVFVCDYTGGYTQQLREFYNPKLKGHLDHIIYGFIVDDEKINTCLFDMTGQEGQFLFYNVDGNLKVYNPFACEENYWTEIPNLLGLYDSSLSRYQVIVYLTYKCHDIRSIFNALRNIAYRIYKKTELTEYEVTRIKQVLKKFTTMSNVQLDGLESNEKEHKNMLNRIKDILIRKLTQYVTMIYHEDAENIVTTQVNTMMKEIDPNHMFARIKDLFFDYADFF